MGCFVVPSLDGEGRGVDTDLDGGGPVCVHLPVFMVVALKLQFQVRPAGGNRERYLTGKRREGGADSGVARSYLHMSVWWTEGRRWKTWLLTARLCSKRNGSSTTPSLTGNVSRSSSLGFAEEGRESVRGDLNPSKKTRRASKRTLVWHAHLEGGAALSYLVSCQAQTGVSRPDLATDTAEYHFLGS